MPSYPDNAVGHIRFNGRNHNAPLEQVVNAMDQVRNAKAGSSAVFRFDDGEGEDFLVWTFGAPISFHMWQASNHN